MADTPSTVPSDGGLFRSLSEHERNIFGTRSERLSSKRQIYMEPGGKETGEFCLRFIVCAVLCSAVKFLYICAVDAHTPCKDLLPGKRRGVCKYELTGDPQHPYNKMDKEKDERLWSFMRYSQSHQGLLVSGLYADTSQ